MKRFWDRLSSVGSFSFVERFSRASGSGSIDVQRISDSVLVFHLKGEGDHGFHACFRFEQKPDAIGCSRLHGDGPLFLFDLQLIGDRLISDMHVCGKDTYRAQIYIDEDLHLRWSIVGPKKELDIHYVYS